MRAGTLYLLGLAVLFVVFGTGNCLYQNFFKYGDRDRDDKLDTADELVVNNLGWLREYHRWVKRLKGATFGCKDDCIVKNDTRGPVVKLSDLKSFYSPTGNIKKLKDENRV